MMGPGFGEELARRAGRAILIGALACVATGALLAYVLIGAMRH